LSVFSICKTSREFKDIHKSEVLISVIPGYPSYTRNDLFENDEIIYSFDEIVKMGGPQSLLLLIPEMASWDSYWALKKYEKWLKAIPELSVNILTQNILLLQPPDEMASWFALTPNVTQTTAHNRYSSQELADKYFMPVHHLSTFVDPSQYQNLPFEKKENLILFSPDETSLRTQIIDKLNKSLPDYKFITIQDLRYEEYKKLMARAKFAITFGEGFDGYYVEAFFSGGITFAVYNADFFPDKAFSGYGNTYLNYETMLANIADDIRQLNNKEAYNKIVKSNFNAICKLYSFTRYSENLRNFYLKRYSYSPDKSKAKPFIASIIEGRDKMVASKESLIDDLNAMIVTLGQAGKEKDAMIADKAAQIDNMLSSKSWKLTKPLRSASALKKRRSS